MSGTASCVHKSIYQPEQPIRGVYERASMAHHNVIRRSIHDRNPANPAVGTFKRQDDTLGKEHQSPEATGKRDIDPHGRIHRPYHANNCRSPVDGETIHVVRCRGTKPEDI